MIRPATTTDLPELMLLAEQMHHESPAYRSWLFDHGKVLRLFESLIAGHGCLLISESDGFLTGGVAGLCTEHWFSSEKVASDLALFVSPDHRNGMLAARLICGFTKWAEGIGARRVTMGVTTGVHPDATGRLYRACGLRPAGEVFFQDF